MSRPVFWLDLDNTLISGVQESPERVVVTRRPGVRKFLEKLGKIGDLGLCTHGVRDHAEQSLRVLGARDKFKWVLSREDLDKVVPGVGPRLGKPGYMFDDFAVGSWLYDLKATALGISPDLWIQVEYFGPGVPDKDGLRKGYIELVRRVGETA